MKEYDYLKRMSERDLISLIRNMLDFEETTAALIELDSRNSTIALELAIDILENDKGDEYLQATVWNIIFFDNKKEAIKILNNRKAIIGKSLLNEIITDLVEYKSEIELSSELAKKIILSYNQINIRNSMHCNFKKFIDAYLNLNP